MGPATAAVAAAGIGALGNIFGGHSAAQAQAGANKMNLKIAREQMMWGAGQSAKQMEFQERMSSTAHQREVQDLLAAGLNPMLALAKAGASTPSGAQASPMPVRVEPVNKMQGVASALQFAQVALGLRQQMADVKKTEAETSNIGASRSLTDAQRDRLMKLVDAELEELKERRNLHDAQVVSIRRAMLIAISKAEPEIEMLKSSARKSRAEADLAEADLPRAKAYSQYYASDLGRMSPAVRQILMVLESLNRVR